MAIASVIMIDPRSTLLTYHRNPHQRAENGTQGMVFIRESRCGYNSSVPDGTVVKSTRGAAPVAGVGAQFVAEVAAVGLGNAALASKKRKAPGLLSWGEPGERTQCRSGVEVRCRCCAYLDILSWKVILIAAMSAARQCRLPFDPRSKRVLSKWRSVTVADVPGLIPGASAGKGTRCSDFLRHIERCAVCAATLWGVSRDPVSDLRTLRPELAAYEGIWARLGATFP